MTTEHGAETIDPGMTIRTMERVRRRRVHLAAAGVLLAVAAGVGALAVVDPAEPSGASLPAVVLGESLEPLAVYQSTEAGLSPDPVATLHVRFAMIRNGPSATTWTVTLAAPEEWRSALATFRGGQRFAILFEGNDYLLGTSYGADYDGSAVDFFTMLPDAQTATRFAESLTNSVAFGPPMGGLAG